MPLQRGAGHDLSLGMATDVLMKLTAVLQGTGTAFPATQHHMVVFPKLLCIHNIGYALLHANRTTQDY